MGWEQKRPPHFSAQTPLKIRVFVLNSKGEVKKQLWSVEQEIFLLLLNSLSQFKLAMNYINIKMPKYVFIPRSLLSIYT